jgi:hypothetical protein
MAEKSRSKSATVAAERASAPLIRSAAINPSKSRGNQHAAIRHYQNRPLEYDTRGTYINRL